MGLLVVVVSFELGEGFVEEEGVLLEQDLSLVSGLGYFLVGEGGYHLFYFIIIRG